MHGYQPLCVALSLSCWLESVGVYVGTRAGSLIVIHYFLSGITLKLSQWW